jgi:hypothetical protein
VQGCTMPNSYSIITVIYHSLLIYHCFSIMLCLSRQAGEFDISQNLANNVRACACPRDPSRNPIAPAQELQMQLNCICTRYAPAQ